MNLISAATASTSTPWTRADYLALVGILISIAGFTVAIIQINRTKSSAKAAEGAIKTTEGSLRRNYLLLFLADFTPLNAELDDAVATGDRRLTARALLSLSRLSSHLAGLLTLEQEQEDQIVSSLRELSTVATLTKKAIINKQDGNLSQQTSKVQSLLATLAPQIGALEIQSAATSKGK